jgi:hypothetical protein
VTTWRLTFHLVLPLLACGVGCGEKATQKPAPSPYQAIVEQIIREQQAYENAKIKQPPDDVCASLTREGDALLTAGKRTEAIAVYERTRSRCVDYAPVRRQLFLARRAPSAGLPPGTPAAGVQLALLVETALPQGLHIVRSKGFLDGLPLDQYRDTALAVGGVQELHVELWFVTDKQRGPGAQATLIDIREQVVIHPSIFNQRPLLGAARVSVRDDGRFSEPVAEKLKVNIQIVPFKPLREIQNDPDAMADRGQGLPQIMVAPNVGTSLRITDIRKELPESLKGRRFWTLQKVCVRASGVVERVNTIKPAELPSDQPIHDWVMMWKYRPYVVNGVPRRFCHPLRLEVR